MTGGRSGRSVTRRERRHVGAVIFDWGGTITPWHTGRHRRAVAGVFAREYHPEAEPGLADELAARIWEAEERRRGPVAATRAPRPASRTSSPRPGSSPTTRARVAGLAAYQAFWEPHTWTDPQIRPLWEGLHDNEIRVGVLSNTIWSRDYHRGLLARDGVLDLVDADVYSSETPWVKPQPEIFR